MRCAPPPPRCPRPASGGAPAPCHYHARRARAVGQPPRPCARAATSTLPPRTRAHATPPPPTATFWIDLEVRDSELDQFAVVNNAVYPQYFQHCRHKYLASVALPADSATTGGGALALSEQSIKFRAPLRSGDLFRAGLAVRPADGGRASARVVIDQWLILTDGTRFADSVATVVSLDANYRPRRVPAPVRAALESGVPVKGGAGWA